MSPGSSTESYPAFAHIGLRENPGKTSTRLVTGDRFTRQPLCLGSLCTSNLKSTSFYKSHRNKETSKSPSSSDPSSSSSSTQILQEGLNVLVSAIKKSRSSGSGGGGGGGSSSSSSSSSSSLVVAAVAVAAAVVAVVVAVVAVVAVVVVVVAVVVVAAAAVLVVVVAAAVACAVSSTQKFLVQQHITTSKHQANKQLNSKQRQLFLTQPTTSNVRSEFNIDLCRSLISADIPLYKLKNKVFREFLEKYTQHTIPDESTLRKTYAPSIYDETIQKIRDEIKDSSIWVSIDETPDKEGRLVGNVVIGLLSEQYSERILLHCDVLEKCNNKTIVKLFNEAMGILWPKGIMYDNVLFFISDAALIWSKLDKHYLLYILN
ncbi:hypothetical protein ANN_02872 [Periplaneta americana]|uniref:DUF659 domain-containing protein n=1 Tax=Periplaneta americana TaxID=6978 RepID=A0ABQ8U239_PERAM|nr:hypothetical protein ANN_02872 [Periplaneta americana]